MNTISIDDFSKIEMKIGKVLEASNIIESSKLLLLKVDFGNNDIRSVVSGIAKYYSPENLINKKFIFVTNLEPRTILQYQSQAMIIASHNIDNTEISLLIPEKDLPEGSLIT
ncbi:MAG TPA: methionine--tRNA ligase subunit beta [Candidatus Paceibacterota bacterium]|jgi:methionine--tRNA ligase beta chain|nr:methionine--tRNA ligase subunit beta [Candidatus Paceibacterota bacterium]